MRQLLFIALVFFAAALCVNAQEDVDFNDFNANATAQDGTWSPKADSPTAMRRSGVITEQSAFSVYTEEHVLSSPLPIVKMKFWNYLDRKVGTTNRFCKQRNDKHVCTAYETIVIRVGVKIRINPNDRTRGIVEGCLNEFIIATPFPQPVVKESAPKPVPTPTPITVAGPCVPGIKVRTRDDANRVTKISDGCTTEITYDATLVNPCPTDIDIDGKVSWGSRLFGGLPQLGISVGGSIGLTKIRGTDWGGSLKSGAKAGATQRVEQAINASEDGIHLVIKSLGIDEKIHKGDDQDLKQGIVVKWSGDHASIWRKVDSAKAVRCDGEGLKETSNIAIWTDGESESQTNAIKDEPIRPVGGGGIGTGNGGRLPGVDVPVNGPVQPIRPGELFVNSYGLVERNNTGSIIRGIPAPSTQTNNSPAKPVTSGGCETININGVDWCKKN